METEYLLGSNDGFQIKYQIGSKSPVKERTEVKPDSCGNGFNGSEINWINHNNVALNMDDDSENTRPYIQQLLSIIFSYFKI